MFKHNIIVAIRSIIHNKVLACVHIIGLSTGIGVSLFVFSIIYNELNFDTFHPGAERIYRIYTESTGLNNSINSGASTLAKDLFKNRLVGVEAVSNFFTLKMTVSRSENDKIDFGVGKTIILTDTDYFKVFDSYEWIIGSAESALEDPFRVVLTESKARFYFGEENLYNIIGREVIYQDSLKVYVSGIIRGQDKSTDLVFTDFISFSTIEKSWLMNIIPSKSWGSVNSISQLFVKLNQNNDRIGCEKQLEEHNVELTRKYKRNWPYQLRLQPLKDLHFNSSLGIFDYGRPTTSKETLLILALVTVLILFIASINFISLSTAQMTNRGKEVGIRKVLGSNRSELMIRYLIESFILTSISGMLGLFMVSLLSPHLYEFVPEDFKFDLYASSTYLILLILVACLVILAGGIPSLVITYYTPVSALKNKIVGKHSNHLRVVLVGFQLLVSQVMILFSFTINTQLQYIQKKDLGYFTSRVIYFYLPHWEHIGKKALLKNELLELPEVAELSLGLPPPVPGGSVSVTYNNGNEINVNHVRQIKVDGEYLDLFNIAFQSGRNFDLESTAKECIINEAYLKVLGIQSPDDALGKYLDSMSIIGVIKNFHTQSLHLPIEPLMIVRGESLCLNIKLAESAASDSIIIGRIRKSWSRVYSDIPFNYIFLDDHIRTLYRSEMRAGKLSKIASILAIVVCCFGLFGLTTYLVIGRNKEIGIRKIHGAVSSQIFLMLMKWVGVLVSSVFIIALPISYFFSTLWLQNFAFKSKIDPINLLNSFLISIGASFFTIIYNIYKASRTNPLEVVKHE